MGLPGVVTETAAEGGPQLLRRRWRIGSAASAAGSRTTAIVSSHQRAAAPADLSYGSTAAGGISPAAPGGPVVAGAGAGLRLPAEAEGGTGDGEGAAGAKAAGCGGGAPPGAVDGGTCPVCVCVGSGAADLVGVRDADGAGAVLGAAVAGGADVGGTVG
jgi:hypothetical protein